MLLLSCSSKLKMLEVALRRLLPETLPVHGSVRTINCGNTAGHEVLVDTWPDFKVVLTRPRREVVIDDSDFYTNTYVAYYQDVGAFRDLLGSAITRNQSFHIHGTQDGIVDVSRDIAQVRGDKLEKTVFFTYLHPDPSTLPEIQLDPSIRLSSLDVSHMDLVNEMWTVGGNKHSRRFLESLIHRFPNFCLLDTSDNPVSWGLLDMFGAMVSGFTLPQHRRHSYSRALVTVLAKQLHAQGYPCYIYVAPENFPMQRLNERLGFQRQPGLCYFMVHNATLNTAPMSAPIQAPGTSHPGEPGAQG